MKSKSQIGKRFNIFIGEHGWLVLRKKGGQQSRDTVPQKTR